MDNTDSTTKKAEWLENTKKSVGDWFARLGRGTIHFALWLFTYSLTIFVPILIGGWTLKGILMAIILTAITIITRLNKGIWQVKLQVLAYGLLVLMIAMWIISYPVAYFTNLKNEKIIKNNTEALIENKIAQAKNKGYPFSIGLGSHTIRIEDEWFRGDKPSYKAKYERTDPKTGVHTIVAFGLDEASSRMYKLSPASKEARNLQDHPTPAVFPISAPWMFSFTLSALIASYIIKPKDNGG